MSAFSLLALALVAWAVHGVIRGEPVFVVCPLAMLMTIVLICLAYSQQIGFFAAMAAK